MPYITDGVHLYQTVESVTNYGKLGGEYLTVLNVVTELVRTLSPLELALCTEVPMSFRGS